MLDPDGRNVEAVSSLRPPAPVQVGRLETRTSVTISSYGLSLILAIIACVIGGALGGLTLVRPGSVLGLTAP